MNKIILLIITLLVLVGCGPNTPKETNLVKPMSVDLPDGEQVVCVVYIYRGGIDCDFGNE